MKTLWLLSFCALFLLWACRCVDGFYVFSSERSAGMRNPAVSAETVDSYCGLSTGASLRYVHRSPAKDVRLKAPPLLFIHGTFHGCWCWDEHWLPYFASKGLDCFAISLRGTAGSTVDGKALAATIKMEDHVHDAAAFIDEVMKCSRPPVIIGHSFGGPIVMKLVEARPERLAGAALLCSVPPSGNTAMIWRTTRRSLKEAVTLTRGFALKTAATNPKDARALFFGPSDPSEATLKRYMDRFAEDSKVGLNLGDFNRNLPIKSMFWAQEKRRREIWKGRGACAAGSLAPARPSFLVVGATKDAVVDSEGVEATAEFVGLESSSIKWLPGAFHDIMLGSTWDNGAAILEDWLETLQKM